MSSQSKRSSVDVARAQEQYRAGATLKQIAQEQGCSYGTIRRRLAEAGEELRGYTGERGATQRKYDREDLRTRYESGQTTREIAEAVGSTPEAIRRILQKAGVPRRRGKATSQQNHFWAGGLTVDRDGYILQHSPEHPHRTAQGYVRQHRLVMEDFLGRFLRPEEVVDHRNGDKSDNRTENLALYPSNADHLRATLPGKPRLTPQEREVQRQAAVQRARQRAAAILAASGDGAGRSR